ncbi:MAG: hypothetical protein IKP40_13085 [Clostridia bacterium]|nr:hypothetical protein [Clostridia bacterium]
MLKRKLLTWGLLLALLCAFAGLAEESPALRGYDKENGYVYLTLGEYPQTAEGGVKPILWRVLTVDAEKAYLCSEYILFARPMHPSNKEYRDVLKGDFGQTELCQYLNTTFASQAFTEAQLDMLLPCENFGKVFLLDYEDAKNTEIGLGSTHKGATWTKKITEDPGLRAWGTEYAIQNNGVTKAKERLYVFQKKYGRCSPYWVRNQSTSDGRHARCTKDGGQLGHIEVARENEGVRPVLYLAQGSYVITGGEGTFEKPYEIAPATTEVAE